MFNLTNDEINTLWAVGEKAGIIHNILDLWVLARQFRSAEEFINYVYAMNNIVA